MERRKGRSKKDIDMDTSSQDDLEEESINGKEQRRSYKDTVLGQKGSSRIVVTGVINDGDVSDDDPIKESMDKIWFGKGMTREEKNEARTPWHNSLMIKIVRRIIGYHYLWRCIQVI